MVSGTTAPDGQLSGDQPSASSSASLERDVLVESIEDVGDDVRAMTLVDQEGGLLPPWEPGAHIDLVLGDGLVRQYSLCGDPRDRTRWRVAVLLEPRSRGGSAYIHREVREGTALTVRGPRNHFPLVPAKSYTFIAGGVGVTPILPMLEAADRDAVPWRLHYGGRSQASMAFVDELQRYGDNVSVRPQDRYGLLDVRTIIDDCPDGTEVYACGPEPLLEAVQAKCAPRPGLQLHIERFSPVPVADSTDEEPFEVECVQSGIVATVQPGCSILATLRERGVEILSSCSEGTCGTCETDVVEGEPDHRDSVLTDAERAANESMMVCVSRCRGRRLKLDL